MALDGCGININSKIKNPLTKIAKKPSHQEESEDDDSTESNEESENENEERTDEKKESE